MARGYSQSRSELPSGIEATKQDIKAYAADVNEVAFKSIPKGTEYAPNMGTVGVETRDNDAIESAKGLQDAFEEWVNNSSPEDFSKDDTPFDRDFKRQYKAAIDGAHDDGTTYGVGGIDSGGGGGYPTEHYSGQGDSGIFKTILKAEGAPNIEMSWEIHTEDDGDGGEDINFHVRGMKILT